MTKWKSLRQAMKSWRTASVTLLSFSSGLPLGLVWISIPDWMRDIGTDIRIVGLFTLAQLPWSFKLLWSPLMDRFSPSWWGKRRGWISLAQIALLLLSLCLALQGSHPETPWMIVALAFGIAFCSATQDIALDAYAVEVLRPEEQGVAVGARMAVYRAAMAVAGFLSITLAASISWKWVNVLLAFLYLPMIFVTWKAPEPEEKVITPKTIREAVLDPIVGFLSKPRAIEMLAFVVFYKFGDVFAQALLRPFLIDMGYTPYDRGIALGTVGLLGMLFGTFFGGIITTLIGLGHSLWFCGFCQLFAHLGYILVSTSEVNRPLMYGAMGLESLMQGMGTGAFSVLLLRMTEKRFSVTQYALFTSLFAFPRVIAGPISGFIVDSIGWTWFFWLTILMGFPGLWMLQRFCPLGVREPTFEVQEVLSNRPLPQKNSWMVLKALLASGISFGLFVLGQTSLITLKAIRAKEGTWDLFFSSLQKVLFPTTSIEWVALVSLFALSGIVGLFVYAILLAQRSQRKL